MEELENVEEWPEGTFEEVMSRMFGMLKEVRGETKDGSNRLKGI